MRTPFFIILFFFIPHLQAQNSLESTAIPKDTVYHWEGKIMLFDEEKQEIPIALHYQASNQVPGRYHKQLVVGQLQNKETEEESRLIGFIQNQEDRSYSLYEMDSKGVVKRTFILGNANHELEGYIVDPEGNEFEGIMRVQRNNTPLSQIDITADSSDVFGNYRYDSEIENSQGTLSVHRNEEGWVRANLYVYDKGTGEEIREEQDSLTISGNRMIWPSKSSGVTIWVAQIQFYKGFAVIGFLEPDSAGRAFESGPAVEGIYIKQD